MVPVRPNSSMASRNCEERMSTIIWGTNTDNTIPSINISRADYIISDNSASESPEQVKKEDNKDGSKYKMRVVHTRSATLDMR